MIDTDKYEELLYGLENKLMQRIEDGERPSDIDLEGAVWEVHDPTSDSGSSGIFLMLMNDGNEWLRIKEEGDD